MKAEHITILGNSVVRDSLDINLKTLDVLKKFQIKSGSKLLDFPFTDFKVKITVTEEGAMFDIVKGADIAYTIACCFDAQYKETILDLVRVLSKKLPFIKQDIIREPKLGQFLYTIPINPLCLSIQGIQTAGEIEFYIYYSLFLARS